MGIIAGVTESIDNENFIPGKDDGLVPLESTKLEGMTDMIILKTSHASMRYSDEVARQIVEFLRNGEFKKDD